MLKWLRSFMKIIFHFDDLGKLGGESLSVRQATRQGINTQVERAGSYLG